MLTDEQLRTWKRLTDAATPGPWRWVGDGLGLRSEGVSMSPDGEVVQYAPSTEGTDVMVIDDPYVFRGLDEGADRAFIAAAREAMPALLAEVERLRTPTGDTGRVGFEAYASQRQADDGALGGEWSAMAGEVPNVAAAWVAAGHAERAVAYALAAQTVMAPGWATRSSEQTAERVRALAHPPADASERMSRVAALMREAGTLAAEVLADADASPELRSSAEGVYRAITGAASETPSMAILRCWEVQRTHGPPGDEVPSAPEALQAAQASAATALEMARLAARRCSSVPLGRALGALTVAGEEVVAAFFMSKQGGANEVTPAFRVPTEEDFRELTEASEAIEDYFGEEKPPTGPSEPLKDGES